MKSCPCGRVHHDQIQRVVEGRAEAHHVQVMWAVDGGGVGGRVHYVQVLSRVREGEGQGEYHNQVTLPFPLLRLV